jgi:hypothetical protein
MAAPQVSGPPGGALQNRPARVPPEESVWKRYSPHHELPVSVTTSVAVHVLFFTLLAFGVLGMLFLPRPEQAEVPPLAVDFLTVENGDGKEPDRRDIDPVGRRRKEEVDKRADKEPSQPPPRPGIEELPPPKVPPPVFPELRDKPEAELLFAQGTQAMEVLARIDERMRIRLVDAQLSRPGPGGSKDTKGPPGRLNNIIPPALRWTVIFNTSNGRDYRMQLADLGAIVAVPLTPDGQESLVFRDLRGASPVGKVEDIGKIQRLSWVDDKPESVRSLAQELNVPLTTRCFVAFFPERLEAQLLELELNYHGKKTEEQIAETHFRIVRRNNHYEPEVVGQRLRRR